MNEIVAGDLAHQNYVAIVKCKEGVIRHFLLLAQYLKECRDSGYYSQLGYENFKEFLSLPEISLSQGYVTKLITAYEVWHEKFGVSQEKLQNIDVEKLYLASQIAGDDDHEEWLDRARELSRSDLTQLIKENGGQECRHEYQEMRICRLCGHREKI